MIPDCPSCGRPPRGKREPGWGTRGWRGGRCCVASGPPAARESALTHFAAPPPHPCPASRRLPHMTPRHQRPLGRRTFLTALGGAALAAPAL
ncbi:hypothetical protein GTY54_38015, partial [Streptomyces sp. SID625]|nr:hypothetical protein [Streptomyces sp. SID625]